VRTLAIFSEFRRLRVAAEQIADALSDLAKMQREVGPALDRIDALELSRHHFEAECAGKLLQADGKLKAASNAEARERQLKRSYERQIDDLDPSTTNGSEVADAAGVLPLDAEAVEDERLRAMRLVVAPSPKAAAIAAKWAG